MSYPFTFFLLQIGYEVISGQKGWIEDVVVGMESRGKDIGRKLIEKLVQIGKEKLFEILLFTEDHKIHAIHLYQSVGFKMKIFTLKTE